ncbi:MAG TPA: hypothetical protein VMR99_03410, partial [Candidatus Paceibacterota bacterium]|nr:hypothetical protein [Candidatus Paceibacterota bacterium]
HLTLQQWFEQNIDVRGMLAASNTFASQTLSDGSTALVLANLRVALPGANWRKTLNLLNQFALLET